MAPSKPRVVLTHGEDRARKALSAEIRKRFGMTTEMPRMGEVIEL
jgi:metallo-beta-lactamase family protein